MREAFSFMSIRIVAHYKILFIRFMFVCSMVLYLSPDLLSCIDDMPFVLPTI